MVIRLPAKQLYAGSSPVPSSKVYLNEEVQALRPTEVVNLELPTPIMSGAGARREKVGRRYLSTKSLC